MPPPLLAASPGPTRLGPPPEPEARPLAQRLALALLLIATAALIGYVLSRPSADVGTSDVLARSVETAGQLQLVLDTADPLEARRLVRSEFGWRVGVPIFEAATLRGVAIAEVAPAVEVPVFLYTVDGREVAVFAYSYALFDQVPDRLRLARSDYDELVDSTPVVRRSGANELLLWRDRDDIYIAVTDIPPSALAGGLTMAR